ncbi:MULTISPECIES: translation initiation factor IF-2 [unclassified Exiguobacterium]|uniref:translation initiation factor IF-2 n=1 Tax=unclassified Exiguobacterium TaxID=2644629 RepID=UPI0020374072|nr:MULTISPECIES: translation initiation factor IF-2 [unclassified Exiguobacterium]
MGKRVYEFAKEQNVTSKQVIAQLEKLEKPVKNHMAVLDEQTVQQLDKVFNPEKHRAQKTEAPKQVKSDNKPNRPGTTTNKPAGNQSRNTKGGRPEFGNRNNRGGKRRPNQKKAEPRKLEVADPNSKSSQRKAARRAQEEAMANVVQYADNLTVGELAEKMAKKPNELIMKLMGMGVMATINQDLDDETVELLASDFGFEVEKSVQVDETDFDAYELDLDKYELSERPPVVTIMGHVDHGKTTLLDSIRNTKVTAGEAGGITQHIGAYQVEIDNKKITFLDTPGHAAFTTMRARGADVTDIAIIVVAADDGVMPQTEEAISHAKAAGVPIIVAVNKMDKEGANPDRVKQELTEFELVAEDWGGDTIFVPVSALKGEGIDELLEMILLVSEVQEYKSTPEMHGRGTVIEAKLDKGRGPVATLLVQHGTLRVGDPVVVGHTFGRIRAMVNDIGRRVKEVGPSTPIEITGLNDVPKAGDQFFAFEDEKKARQIGEARYQREIEAQRRDSAKVSLEDLFDRIKEGEVKDLNIIIKGDVQGSVEALAGSLKKIDVEGVKINIVHSGVGAITEGDVILASAANAIIIGFNVRPDGNAKSMADQEKVEIRLHKIIYNAIEEIEQAMKGLLDPEFVEKIIGQAEVRDVIKVSKVGTIAGGYVTEGKLTRAAGVRVVRDSIVIYEGKLDTLRRFKDDVKEVATGYECGIKIEKYDDIKVDDVIEAFIMEEVKRK